MARNPNFKKIKRQKFKQPPARQRLYFDIFMLFEQKIQMYLENSPRCNPQVKT